MTGDVEAENLLLFRQALRLGPRWDVGQHVAGFGRARVAGSRSEQRRLPGDKVLLSERCLADRDVQRRRQLRAVTAQRIHCAGVDESLEHALVADAKVDSLAQIEDRLEGAILGAGGKNGINRRSANVPDAAQSEAKLRLADDGELVT